jgi:hypothetical protein
MRGIAMENLYAKMNHESTKNESTRKTNSAQRRKDRKAAEALFAVLASLRAVFRAFVFRAFVFRAFVFRDSL